MIITVKNLQQQTFTIEFEPEKTVLELKETIFRERGPEYVVAKQKLIYAGVILDDKRTIASYNVDEKKFLVIMLKRDFGGTAIQKPDESAATTSHSDAAAVSTQLKIAVDSDSKKEVEKTTTTAAKNVGGSEKESGDVATAAPGITSANRPATETSQSTNSSDDLAGVLSNTSLQSRAEYSLLMGDEYNRSVDSMIEMGYSREMVERAMAASYNNPERAVEYLITGIPESGEEGFNALSAAAILRSVVGEGAARPGGDGATNRGGDGDGSANIASTESGGNSSPGEDPFSFLRDQPQFLQMRSLVNQNPDLLHAVLQQIGHTNPALLQLISENQEAFLGMLNQPIAAQSGTRRPQATATATSADATRQRSVEGSADTIPLPTSQDTAVPERAANVGDLTSAGAAVAGTVERDTGNVERIGSGVAVDAGEQVGADGPTIRLSMQDRDAIERLKGLGFPEMLVLQAYFACEKDEQLAANFLISSAFDD